MKTQKVYWEDPYLQELTAKIIEISPEGLLLDKTIIYPGGGGQDRDFGVIIGADDTEYAIEGIEKVEHGIYHQVKGDLDQMFKMGEIITLKLDWTRRYAHMRAHSSQHVFSAYLLDHFDANTMDITLGSEEVTLVLDKEIEISQLEEAVAGVISVVTRNTREIRSEVDSSTNIKKKFGSKIRGGVPESEAVRVLNVENWDIMCCGGTHVANTREIGPIMVYKFNKNKEIRYYIGEKAIGAIAAVNISGLQAAGALSQTIENFSEELEKRLQEVERLRNNVKLLEEKVVENLLTSPGTSIGDALVKSVEVPINRKLLNKIVKKLPSNTIICAQLPDIMVMVISTHKKATAKVIIEKYFANYGGKGGGSPRSAQGKLSAEIMDFQETSHKIIEEILNC